MTKTNDTAETYTCPRCSWQHPITTNIDVSEITEHRIDHLQEDLEASECGLLRLMAALDELKEDDDADGS